MKNKLRFIIVFALLNMFCNGEKYKKTVSGMMYKIYNNQKGFNASIGDVLTIHLINSTQNDSEIINTWKDGKPLVFTIEMPDESQDLMEGLTLLSEGDSAVFLLSSDSMLQYSKEIIDTLVYKKGTYVKYAIKVLKIERHS